uniref:Reverse transcriptase Ty1/copia-type domain-containing protein n=1 Tax=Megaselia scalaris TaxID=36166 RepID=T1H0X1_MEGSC
MFAHNYHALTKHIDIKHHFIRDLIDKNIIKFEYKPTDEMIADFFTKPIFGPKHADFTYQMGLKMINLSGVVE